MDVKTFRDNFENRYERSFWDGFGCALILAGWSIIVLIIIVEGSQ